MFEWYLFAIFVFGLLYVLILLYSKYISGKYPDVSDYKQREERLFKLYQNIEDLMDGFEEYVEEVREDLLQEISEKKKELYEELHTPKVDAVIPEVNAKEIYNSPNNNTLKNSSNPVNDTGNSKSTKIHMVNELLNEGMSVDDIARKLNIGKGEIKLIIQLSNKKTKV